MIEVVHVMDRLGRRRPKSEARTTKVLADCGSDTNEESRKGVRGEYRYAPPISYYFRYGRVSVILVDDMI